MRILVDGMNIVMRNHYVHDTKKGLKTSAGAPTGTIYGFLQTMMRWRKAYPQHELMVCWDDLIGGSDYRRRIYPQYKANRPQGGLGAGGEFQVEMLNNLLRSLGIHQVYAQGAEADDLIATLCRQSQGMEVPTIIMTNDRDMFQLVGDKVVVITPQGGEVYDRDTVIEVMGIAPEHLVCFRSLDGDTSDNIPRVPGVRRKTLAKITTLYAGDLNALYEALEGGNLRGHVTAKEHEKIAAFKGQAFVNAKIIALREIPDFEMIRGRWDAKEIEGMCGILEFSDKTIADLLAMKKTGFIKTARP